jgi:hypothetical protein
MADRVGVVAATVVIEDMEVDMEVDMEEEDVEVLEVQDHLGQHQLK